jgi:endonuclease-3 related protein
MTCQPRGDPQKAVRAIYRKLSRAWGPQHWWPAETPFEVIVGAILTQNTSWKNVERAMASLRAAGRLSLEGIRDIAVTDLEQLVRSSGYYRQKADRLKRFVAFLDDRYGGSLENMFATSTAELRAQLLSLKGIGHETADAILVYAGNHEIFVVDAYARRILHRHGVIEGSADYDEIRSLVEGALSTKKPAEAEAVNLDFPETIVIHQPSAMSTALRSPRSQIYNEMHGLFVQVGKHYCEKLEPRCRHCPLRDLLPESGPRL